ncbi:probable leucine-rich repeat receptor-like protein kinase At1g35710 [Magnolia sinica]|uniref:probable leucine-rich repeat receptor-like protein kinase At1g35710 n=1 Tax=Magnolia sinica TaxID=86752 RepID=UPI002658578D|nr:probable leucine-rich repeat receptor-like protein kinase At1g35710 [Magnolia sinica]
MFGWPSSQGKAFQQAPAEAFSNDEGLCCEVQGLSPCNSHLRNKKGQKIAIVIILPLLDMLLLLFGFAGISSIFHPRARDVENKVKGTSNRVLFSIWNYNRMIMNKDIIDTTEDFNEQYCIGMGGYGNVQAAEEPTVQVVAVKKIDPLESREIRMRKTLEVRGSLASIQSNDEKAMESDWVKKLKVIKGVAHAP